MVIKSLSVRIDQKTLDKLHILSDYDGRSANSEILYLIRREIESFEKKHGEINI